MKKISLLTLAVFVFGVFSCQTASAQPPVNIKIPKPSQPQPEPTRTDTVQPKSNVDVRPGRPQPDSPNTTAPAAAGATINKPSIQVTLRTHPQYYRAGQIDQDTWSWSPRINFRVNGPIPAGSQLSVEYTLPSGTAWVKHDCQTEETRAGALWETECGVKTADVPDQQASIETGLAGFKINLTSELEGKTAALFSGKFKVEKFHVGVIDLPKFKNNFSYYVDYDWTLPIGYVYGSDVMDMRKGRNPSQTEARLSFVTWFKGDPRLIDYGEYVAYLYYQGKPVADSAGGGGKYGDTSCQVTNAAFHESANTYCRRSFTVNAMVWDKQAEFHPQDFKMYENPGEYEIKVLQNGKLARTAKFAMGRNGRLVDPSIGPQNNLGTGRILVAVQVIGEQDGAWDRHAYKTHAFFGNPLTGFVAP